MTEKATSPFLGPEAPTAPASPFLPTPIAYEPARMYVEEEVEAPTPRKPGLRMRDLTDEDVVLSLLQNPSKLNNFEKGMFENFCQIVERGRELTDNQRKVARKKFEVLNLIETFDRDNLASTLKVKGAKVDARTTEALNELMGPKPCAPPGAKRQGDDS